MYHFFASTILETMRLALAFLFTCCLAYAQPTAQMRQLFTEKCAGCHGDRMQGARAGSLLDATWTYGGTDDKILESIRDGRAEAGMPSFKTSLTDVQMRGLLLLMRINATQAQGQPATQATRVVDGVVRSAKQTFRIETLTDAVETPWGIAFLPDGKLLITERPGRLRVFANGKLGDPVQGIPTVWTRQDGGLFDVEVHPNYAQNGWIYLAFAEPRETNRSMTTIVRGKLRDNRWVEQEYIYRAPDELFTTVNFHYGLRFIFDRKGFLYYSLGDHGKPESAQDLSQPTGKIHRVHDDGKIPADNPFVKTPGALGTIWSYGHRNPEGFSFAPNGTLWSTEHGPTGGDEVNVIQKGRNYGWPVISWGLMDNGLPTPTTAQSGMEQPVAHWEPSPGIAPVLAYNGSQYKDWKGDVLVGTMGHEELRRLRVKGTRVLEQEVVFKGLGRVRDFVLGPDGLLYVALADPGPQLSSTTKGRVVRLVPTSLVPTK
jgi:aldose sugar dehydrogenase